MRCQFFFRLAILLILWNSRAFAQPKVVTLPGTKPLVIEGDIASQMVEGIDKFLLRQLEESVKGRAKYWKRDFSSTEAYNKSIEPNRKRLAKMLGVVDERVKFDSLELVGTLDEPALIAEGMQADRARAGLVRKPYKVYRVRWPVLANPHPLRSNVVIYGEGLLFVPGNPVGIDVIALPHTANTPEQIAGLAKGVSKPEQFARRLVQVGARVLVPTLINREERFSNLSNREWLYRSSFEVGRHLIGLEVQKVLAGVDWFTTDAKKYKRELNLEVIGYGDGAMIAMYAAALDTRINTMRIDGFFEPMESVWKQPIDRNVFGLLREFGAAEIVAMAGGRLIEVEATKYPVAQIKGGRGAPGSLAAPKQQNLLAEARRLHAMTKSPDGKVAIGIQSLSPGSDNHRNWGLDLGRDTSTRYAAKPPRLLVETFDSKVRHRRQVEEIDRYNQLLLRDCAHKRYQTFWKNLDLSSVEKYEKSIEPFRQQFRDEVIGSFDIDMLPANARSRKDAETDKWTRYEVVLDVYQDVIAYGLLIVPKDIKKGERRPVVVCQHGLEGRPQDVIGESKHQYYKAFATSLAERGFVTFAPQNPYIFKDRFRTLQRKANPLGKTLFSIIVPQHQQITDWLKTQPFVDGKRIGFYGLSYGGKSAMRIPPLVDNYCLSICSADFNEWVWKNASTSPFAERYTYSNKGEYEIFEWDLGHTFNYAEMAALIAPRPFMVERGHDDGVAPDEMVAFEYAKVRRLYNKLGIGDRTEIEFFNGPHSINGDGTFEFLHKHLHWPKPK